MRYVIDAESFEPRDVFECGQCFRWNKEDDDSYTGIFGNYIVNVKKENDKIIIDGNFEDTSEIDSYFDLKRNYNVIKSILANVDDNLKNSIQYGNGIRILNQNLWETIISFIISANNNIPRIKGIIDRISKKYGKEICYEGKVLYTFPTPEELSKASVQDLKDVGLGFRDVRVFETTRKIASGEFDLEELYKMSTDDARDRLLTLDGVGPKVADCILLFSDLKRFDVFPIDVWVRRVMNELYIHNQDETKVSKKEIKKIADEKFGSLQGIAQQYLFYWKRESA